MEQEQVLFPPPEKIKSLIRIDLTKVHGNYQKVLDDLEGIVITEGTIEQVQNVMRNLNAFIKFIEDHRKDEKEPYLDHGRLVDAAHKEVSDPFLKVKDRIQIRLNEVAKAKAARLFKEQQETDRKNGIKAMINNTILDFATKIASADRTEQLLSYERLINLEKANKTRYQEFLPDLIDRCNELNDKIKAQKELVRGLEAAQVERELAEKAGDDAKVEKLLNKEAEISQKLADNTVQVQEQAANTVLSNEDITQLSSPKARYTTWKAEIANENQVIKKAPELLIVSLNTAKAKEVLNTLKDSGALKGKIEYFLNGIRYFEEKIF